MLNRPIAALLLALALPFTDGCAAAHAAGQTATVAVDITGLGGLARREIESLRQETERVWQPHGVGIQWLPAGEITLPDEHVRLRLTVVINALPGRPDAVTSRSGAALLGAVQFEAGSLLANDIIVLSVGEIARAVLAAPYLGRPVHRWPPATIQQLTGRALGRVLAHEIGHAVIAWRGHTDSGLMRASFDPELLVSPDLARLRIAPLLVPRLRARLAEIAGGTAAAQARRIIRPQPEVSDGNPAEPAGVLATRPTPLPRPGGGR